MRLIRQLQPALAAFLAACVLLLGLAAVSPALHESLCTGESQAHHNVAHQETVANVAPSDPHHCDTSSTAPADGDDDHACAVHLFAHGCTANVPAVFSAPPELNATRVAHFTEFMLDRTLRGPARVCGPPVLA
jgi:hypothetical protein